MTPEQRKANRLYLAADTMRESRQYLEAYAELLAKDSTAFKTHCSAILQLAIVCYCKSFIASKSGNKADPKIEVETVGLFAKRQDFKELHDKLFEKRHKLIAHTEWDFHATKLVDSYLDPGDFSISVQRHSRKHNPCAGIDAALFHELTTLLAEEFDDKCFRLDSDRANNSPVKPRA